MVMAAEGTLLVCPILQHMHAVLLSICRVGVTYSSLCGLMTEQQVCAAPTYMSVRSWSSVTVNSVHE